MLATLILSFGVPLLLGGDEFGRTQQGNNNAYCQDNQITWFDWSQADPGLWPSRAGWWRFEGASGLPAPPVPRRHGGLRAGLVHTDAPP